MTELKQSYYETYWSNGIDAWSPAGVGLSQAEKSLLLKYVGGDSCLLDFGCGDGSHVGEYMRERCNYVGADISASAVEQCRRKGLRAVQIEVDGRLPFEKDSFDVVVCFEVLEHLFAPAAAVRDILRVLRPGGIFLGSVPNTVFLGNRVLMVLGHFNPGGSPATSLKRPWEDPHIRFFSASSLSQMLEECGFTSVEIMGAPFSLIHFPVLYRLQGLKRRVLERASSPVVRLGRTFPSLFAYRLYFASARPQ